MDKKYDIFISFKNSDANGKRTRDSEIAEKLYYFLMDKGFTVFYSNKELESIGKARYAKVIAEALESSSFLIAVGCSRENLEADWVSTEWESFLNNIRRGTKKPPTDVYVVYENMKTDDLPWFLRDQQSFDASKKDSFERLYNFISNAINGLGGDKINQPEKPGGNTARSDDLEKIEERKRKKQERRKKILRILSRISIIILIIFVCALIGLIGFGVYKWINSDKSKPDESDDVIKINETTLNDIKNEKDTIIEPMPMIEEQRGNTGGNIVNNGYIAQQGDWVYYVNNNDGGKLYKMRTDGSEKKRLNDDMNWYINVIGEWVYYQNDTDGENFYKIRTNGSEKAKLGDDKIYYINMIGDWVYYRNGSDGGKLCKIRTDGSEKKRLDDDQSWYLNVADDWVYYCNDTDGGKLYKIRTDGSGKKQLNGDKSWYLNVAGDWIYYCNGSDGRNLYKIRTDGTERQIVD
jgi:hypothetical protein